MSFFLSRLSFHLKKINIFLSTLKNIWLYSEFKNLTKKATRWLSFFPQGLGYFLYNLEAYWRQFFSKLFPEMNLVQMDYTCWRDAVECLDVVFLNLSRLSFQRFQKIREYSEIKNFN